LMSVVYEMLEESFLFRAGKYALNVWS